VDFYNIQLEDNVKARIIDSEMKSLKNDNGKAPTRAQTAIYDYLKWKIDNNLNGVNHQPS
jgi:hypothetical protein